MRRITRLRAASWRNCSMSKIILGISAFYHDSAAAIVRDGHIVAAAQEERFSRKKHDPLTSAKYCDPKMHEQARVEKFFLPH